MPDFLDDLEELLGQPTKPTRTSAEIERAEKAIVTHIKDVRYIIREYPVDVVVDKYLSGRRDDTNEIYVPDYQRDLIWPARNRSRFIESLLIGLPIPYIFVADVNDPDDPDKTGRLEIVDGVQRIRTLAEFLTNRLTLTGLDRLTELNGFRFSDLQVSRQRRFKRSTLRLIELTEAATEDVRREMFDRINSGSVTLEAVEIRRGMQPGPFLTLTTELAHDPMLQELAPVSEALQKRFEYEELVTRFFAFLTDYKTYGTGDEGKVVSSFLLAFVKRQNIELEKPDGDRTAETMRGEWKAMLRFIKQHFPDGFRKQGRGRKVPRVRFEALSVGVGLALRSGQPINTADIPKWLDSAEFKDWTTSDAANNRSNLVGRIEYVEQQLLKV